MTLPLFSLSCLWRRLLITSLYQKSTFNKSKHPCLKRFVTWRFMMGNLKMFFLNNSSVYILFKSLISTVLLSLYFVNKTTFFLCRTLKLFIWSEVEFRYCWTYWDTALAIIVSTGFMSKAFILFYLSVTIFSLRFSAKKKKQLINLLVYLVTFLKRSGYVL